MRSRPGAQHQSAECIIASCVVLIPVYLVLTFHRPADRRSRQDEMTIQVQSSLVPLLSAGVPCCAIVDTMPLIRNVLSYWGAYLDFLYGGLFVWRAVPISVLSLCLFFSSSLINLFSLPDGLRQFLFEIITPYMLCDV
jgi:hypothetical protein